MRQNDGGMPPFCGSVRLSLTQTLCALLRMSFFPGRTTKLEQFADLLEPGEFADARRGSRAHFQDRRQRAEQRPRRTAHSGCFRQPVVRSGGVVHRPGTRPRLTPCPEVEWIVAPASPCSRRDAFLIGDSSQHTNRGLGVARLHGTRSHDQGTPDEWNQSLAPHRLSAKGNAV